MSDAWTQAEAIALCRKIEDICPAFGCHVALTGGLLYKVGERKDLDILFYRIRQVDEIDINGLFSALGAIGFVRITTTNGFCIKSTHRDRKVDCFFPEAEPGEYPTDAATTEAPAPFADLFGSEDIAF